MALPPMLPLFLSTILGLTLDLSAAPHPGFQEPAQPLEAPVLIYGERQIPASEVLKRLDDEQGQLMKLLQGDADYRAAYLASPRFLASVRAYADLLRVEELGVRKATPEELLAEARAYGADRKSRLSPEALLRAQPIEIEVRARLLTQQSAEFTTSELRQHMLRSVPEFFGELQVSWIRVPLVDTKAARALTQEETRAVYDRLDEAATRLQAEEISWKDAVEKYSKDPLTQERDGAVGILKRTMTDRFEEPMLRALFADLGFKAIENEILRGPILGQKWAYLVRIEGFRIDGVPELQRARARVERSLRETLMQEQLAGIRQVIPAQVLAPLVR